MAESIAPAAFASFNKQGDITRTVKRADGWSKEPLYTTTQLEQVRLEEQTSAVAQVASFVKEQSLELYRLQAALAAAQRDATRYAKLRNSGWVYPKEGLDDSGWCPYYEDDVDYYVDNLRGD